MDGQAAYIGSDSKADGDGAPLFDRLDSVIDSATQTLLERQQEDGHWVFELEADATIPSEFIMLNHFLGELDEEAERKCAVYIRRRQSEEGGWPLFHGGDIDLSCSVKAYWALKLVGDDPDDDHMRRAREAIHAKGGAERSNVFTRYSLALFGEVPWRAVPVMPTELMLAPRWFPVNMWRFSYWSRTVIAPLLILAALKPKAVNPGNITIKELFSVPPEEVDDYFADTPRNLPGRFFLALDRLLRCLEPYWPKKMRGRAIDKAVQFFTERLNGEDGLGAIFPAMANAVMAMETLGYPKDHPDLVTAKAAIRKLLTEGEDGERYCQPCLSPIWDTALTSHALEEVGSKEAERAAKKGCEWLVEREITELKGDWAVQRPDLEPGGWAFQYNNAHYPDVDDTAVVGMILERSDHRQFEPSIERAVRWIEGMQSSNGGWGAFDVDNDDDYLNYIPFADHGALLDPPTADVSARCISFLAQRGHSRNEPLMARALQYLRNEQEADGSWYGRWGTNYVYGTWSALCAFNAANEPMDAPHIRMAVDWLISRQREDGGWGEDGATYWLDRKAECKESTPSQTAWALLGLMAAGELENAATRRGIEYLLNHPREDSGRWEEPWYTAVGFPRVFYLRYHGYSAYFPLWALARYRNLTNGNNRRPVFGM